MTILRRMAQVVEDLKTLGFFNVSENYIEWNCYSFEFIKLDEDAENEDGVYSFVLSAAAKDLYPIRSLADTLQKVFKDEFLDYNIETGNFISTWFDGLLYLKTKNFEITLETFKIDSDTIESNECGEETVKDDYFYFVDFEFVINPKEKIQ